MVTNYRTEILRIADSYAKPGDDWEQAILSGAPDEIDAAEARGIAEWLHEEADSEWGENPRHHTIADEILALLTE